MASVTGFRALADRCFIDAATTDDPRQQDKARSRAYHYLEEAHALERQEAWAVLGDARHKLPPTMSPLQNAAMVQLARVEVQMKAIMADAPPARSARANILAFLRQKKSQLERDCGLSYSKDRPE